MSDETRNDDLNNPLVLLQRLDPQPVHLDRERFFFSAGESSARGELRHSRRLTAIWPAAAAALAVVCVVLGLQIARMSDDLARLPVREGGMIVQQENAEPDALVPDGPGKLVDVSTFDSHIVERKRVSPHSGPLRAGDRYVDVSRWIPAERPASAHSDTIRADDSDKRKTYLEIRKELSAT
jgi:hypothetical protein